MSISQPVLANKPKSLNKLYNCTLPTDLIFRFFYPPVGGVREIS